MGLKPLTENAACFGLQNTMSRAFRAKDFELLFPRAV